MTDPLTIQGVGASAGLAVGRAFAIDRARVDWSMRRLPDEPDAVPREKDRLLRAFADSREKLLRILDSLEPSSEQASILETHLLMLKDPMFMGEALQLIEKERINAEWALNRLVQRFKGVFSGIKDEYLRERSSDIEFVGEQILRHLAGRGDDMEAGGRAIPPGSIIVARDLSPADATTLLRRTEVKGIVTDLGAKTSHVAIIARALGLPCIVGAQGASDATRTGDLVVLDGETGGVTVNPAKKFLEDVQNKLRRLQTAEAAAHALKKLPAVSLDGRRVRLMGNMDDPFQLPLVSSSGAEGVGLFRTEILFLDRKDLPDEEEHFAIYSRAVRALGGKPITFRTLDLGADKMLRLSDTPMARGEPNPALGLRGVRYCLRHRDLFILQLKAILRAAALGPVRILLPMITELSEVREARACIEEAAEALRREGREFSENVPLGAMIETPGAVWSADRLARACDFFSVGTNDLIQYALALDRQNADVAYLYSPFHIAVLRGLRFTTEAAHQAGIPISMCGEMAGDPLCTFLLLGLGMDTLSMVFGQIPKVKRILRAASASEAQAFAEEVMAMGDVRECERFVREEMERRFQGLF